MNRHNKIAVLDTIEIDNQPSYIYVKKVGIDYELNNMIVTSTDKLAPMKDGRCYCNRMRNKCLNYKAYGMDCQGFTNEDYNSTYYIPDEFYEFL